MMRPRPALLRGWTAPKSAKATKGQRHRNAIALSCDIPSPTKRKGPTTRVIDPLGKFGGP